MEFENFTSFKKVFCFSTTGLIEDKYMIIKTKKEIVNKRKSIPFKRKKMMSFSSEKYLIDRSTEWEILEQNERYNKNR